MSRVSRTSSRRPARTASASPRSSDCSEGSRAHTGGRAPMRIWIDLSAPAHPVVFRPLVRRLREGGHQVEVTARDFAQTLELAELAGLDALAVGAHGGRS